MSDSLPDRTEWLRNQLDEPAMMWLGGRLVPLDEYHAACGKVVVLEQAPSGPVRLPSGLLEYRAEAVAPPSLPPASIGSGLTVQPSNPDPGPLTDEERALILQHRERASQL